MTHYAHKNYKLQDKEKLSIVTVQSPEVPDITQTLGGPVYLSIGQQFSQSSVKDNKNSSTI